MIELNKVENKYYLSIEPEPKVSKPNLKMFALEDVTGQDAELLEHLGSNIVLLDKSTNIIKAVDAKSALEEIESSNETNYSLLILKNKPTAEIAIENYNSIKEEAELEIGVSFCDEFVWTIELLQMTEKELDAVLDKLNEKYKQKVSELRAKGLGRLTYKEKIQYILGPIEGMLFILFAILLLPFLLIIFCLGLIRNMIEKWHTPKII